MRPSIVVVTLTTTILAAPLPSPGPFYKTIERSLATRDPNFRSYTRSLKTHADQEEEFDRAHSMFPARALEEDQDQGPHVESIVPDKNAQNAGIKLVVDTQGEEPEAEAVLTSHINVRDVIDHILANRAAEPINRINDREADPEPVNRNVHSREADPEPVNRNMHSREADPVNRNMHSREADPVNRNMHSREADPVNRNMHSREADPVNRNMHSRKAEPEPINRINGREVEPINRINDREDETEAYVPELYSRAVRGSDKRTVRGSDKRTVRGSDKRAVRGSEK